MAENGMEENARYMAKIRNILASNRMFTTSRRYGTLRTHRMLTNSKT